MLANAEKHQTHETIQNAFISGTDKERVAAETIVAYLQNKARFYQYKSSRGQEYQQSNETQTALTAAISLLGIGQDVVDKIITIRNIKGEYTNTMGVTRTLQQLIALRHADSSNTLLAALLANPKNKQLQDEAKKLHSFLQNCLKKDMKNTDNDNDKAVGYKRVQASLHLICKSMNKLAITEDMLKLFYGADKTTNINTIRPSA